MRINRSQIATTSYQDAVEQMVPTEAWAADRLTASNDSNSGRTYIAAGVLEIATFELAGRELIAAPGR